MRFAASILAFAVLLCGRTTSAASAEELEALALLLAMRGHPCARALDYRRQDGTLEVICIEHRGGTRRVLYVVDARSRRIFRPGLSLILAN